MGLSRGHKRNLLWIKLRGFKRDFEFVGVKTLCRQPGGFGLQGEDRFGLRRLSYTYFAKQRAPLPHCPAAVPSAL